MIGKYLIRPPMLIGAGIVLLALFTPVSSGAVVALLDAPTCNGSIDRILFRGNEVTRERVLRNLTGLIEGQQCSREQLLRACQSLMNSGLFKSVIVAFDAPASAATFTLTERYYSLPIPRFDRTADGELRIGGQLQLDNVLGLNHRFRATARREVEDDGKGYGGERLKMSYDVPRLSNSKFGFHIDAGALDKNESVMGEFQKLGLVRRREGSLSLSLSRYYSSQSALQGWRRVFGVGVIDRRYELEFGDRADLVSGRVTRFRFATGFRRVQTGQFRRLGYEFGAALSGATDKLLSDYSFVRLDVFYQAFIPLAADTYNSLNLRVKLGAADRGPFGETTYSLGGSDTVRGFASNTQLGQRLALLNVEYLNALQRRPSLRWSLFMDMGAVKGKSAFRLSNIKTAVGAGIRWKVRSFVNTDLRLDAAWGLGGSGGEMRYYFGTNVIF